MEEGVYESSVSREGDGMGKDTKQAWATMYTQDNRELPVVRGISDTSPIEGGGFQGSINSSEVRRQSPASPADSFYTLVPHGSSRLSAGSGAQVAGVGSQSRQKSRQGGFQRVMAAKLPRQREAGLLEKPKRQEAVAIHIYVEK